MRLHLQTMNAPRIRPFLRQARQWTASASKAPTPIAHRQQSRWQHHNAPSVIPTPPRPPRVPPPIPLVPDVKTFLTVIGRGLAQHAPKFPTWESLFEARAEHLKALGVEPPRTRRYLIRWMERFRLGLYGPGGDLVHVGEDGTAALKVAELRIDATTYRKVAVNVPRDKKVGLVTDEELAALARPDGYTVRGARSVVGPYALPASHGDGAEVKVTEGMWEDRRGHKVDGGERRKAMVRYMRRLAEKRAAKEQAKRGR